MHSGIGPAAHLKDLGITPCRCARGRRQPARSPRRLHLVSLPTARQPQPPDAPGPCCAGLSQSGPVPTRSWARKSPSRAAPSSKPVTISPPRCADHVGAGLAQSPRRLQPRHGFLIHVYQMRPPVAARIALRSANPNDKPVITAELSVRPRRPRHLAAGGASRPIARASIQFRSLSRRRNRARRRDRKRRRPRRLAARQRHNVLSPRRHLPHGQR